MFLKKISDNLDLMQKAIKFSTAHVFRMAMLEFPAFMCVFFTMQSNNSFYFVLVLILVLMMLSIFPTKNKFESDVPLTSKEKSILEKGTYDYLLNLSYRKMNDGSYNNYKKRLEEEKKLYKYYNQENIYKEIWINEIDELYKNDKSVEWSAVTAGSHDIESEVASFVLHSAFGGRWSCFCAHSRSNGDRL